jgi:hypothetical protein
MKKVILSVAIVGLLSTSTQAQGLLGKLKGNKEKTEEAATTTATDEWGISGNYTFSSPWEMDGKKIKSCAVVFTKEENGTIVNRLELTVGKSSNVSKFILDEKIMNKNNIKLFKGGIYTPNYTEFEIMQLDNGILFLNCTAQKGYVVLAKNADDLKTWDEETGLAKYEAEKKKVSAVATAGLRKKLDDFAAYKKNVGKIVFARSKRTFDEFEKDKPTEDVDLFFTQWTTGNGLGMRAYFDKAIDEVCKGCNGKVNYVFEMGKHKIDWMQLRSSSSAFSSMFEPTTFGHQYMTGGVWLWDDYDYNRALTMVIHKNITDGSLKDNASMPMKVTIYAYSDKTNGVKLAEGTLSVKYAADASNWIERYRKFKDAIE